MTTTVIPNASDVRTGSGIANWRFSGGQIVRGREADNSLEVAEHGLVGILRRVGIHRGTLDDGRPYAKLEAEIETSEGVASVGANLTSMMAAITLGEGLLAVKRGDLIKFTAGRSKERNKFGSYTTYANVYSVNPQTLAPSPAREKRLTTEKSLDQVMAQIEAELRRHDAWGERPQREDAPTGGSRRDDSPSWVILAREIEQAGKWPLIGNAKQGYLDMASSVYKALKHGEEKTYASLDAIDEFVIAQMRQGHDRSTDVPKILQPYMAVNALPLDDYDPFA